MRWVLGVLMLLLTSSAQAECVKHTPYARYMEQVRILEPGATAVVEVLFRNSDSCECAPTCFSLSYGYHPPAETPGLRVSKMRLRTPEDRPLSSVCLAPGEEATGYYHLTAATEQDGAGHVWPSIFMYRTSNRGNTPEDFLVDQFDTEGPALCIGYDYETCREFVYQPQPPS
jgi:hypothetical protein